MVTPLPADRGERMASAVRYDRVMGLWLWPDVSLVESQDRLTIAPRGIPMLFAVSCMVFPLLAGVTVLLYEWLVERVFVWHLALALLVLGVPAAVLILVLVRFINRRVGAGVPVAELDRKERTLRLCDEGRVLNANTIIKLEISRNLQTDNSGGEVTSMRVSTLFATATSPDGQATCYTVVSCGRRKPIERFAREVADCLKVPLTDR